jgi:hypothetical protein
MLIYLKIIDASAKLGLVPTTLGKNNSIDWIPVDILADVIVQLAFISNDSEAGRVFHLVNPQKAAWEDLLPSVVDRLKALAEDGTLDVVPLSEWVDSLISYQPDGKNSAGLSALKLVDFFQSLNISEGHPTTRAVFDTTVTAANCETFEQLPSVHQGWMKIWLEQWGY